MKRTIRKQAALGLGISMVLATAAAAYGTQQLKVQKDPVHGTQQLKVQKNPAHGTQRLKVQKNPGWLYFKFIHNADLNNLHASPHSGPHDVETPHVVHGRESPNHAILGPLGEKLRVLATKLDQASPDEIRELKHQAHDLLQKALAQLGVYRPDLVVRAPIDGQVGQMARIKSYNREFMHMTPEQQAFFGTPDFDEIAEYAIELKQALERVKRHARKRSKVSPASPDEVAKALEWLEDFTSAYHKWGGDKRKFKNKALLAFGKALTSQGIEWTYRMGTELWKGGDHSTLRELSTHQQDQLKPLVEQLFVLRDLLYPPKL